MNKVTLKTLRLIIPGIIFLIGLLPVAFEFFGKKIFEEPISNTTFLTIIAVIFGAIYYIFNLRKYAIKQTHQKIVNNIKDKLLEILRRHYRVEQLDELNRGDTLIHVFYTTIDNDASLTEKSKSVMLNGIVWTTTADLTVISIILFVIYSILAFFKSVAWAIALFFLFVGVASYFLHRCAAKRQIELSNEQLDFIRCQKVAALRESADRALSGL